MGTAGQQGLCPVQGDEQGWGRDSGTDGGSASCIPFSPHTAEHPWLLARDVGCPPGLLQAAPLQPGCQTDPTVCPGDSEPITGESHAPASD